MPLLVQRAAVGAAAVWFAALVAGPLLPGAIGAPLYLFASLVCHQLPERSFHVDGAQLPVCARCIGIYAGAAAGAFGVLLRRPGSLLARLGERRLIRRLAWWSVAPTAVTVVLEWSGAWQSSNAARCVAGVVLGWGAAFVAIGSAATLHYSECSRRGRPAPPASIPI